MKRLVTVFLIAVFLLLALPAVKADFTLKEKLTTNVVCPSSTILIQHVVTAHQSGPFTVAVSGTAARFSTTVPSGFWLGEGQSQTVYTYITPSTKITPGKYSFELTVESQGDIEKAKHDIVVENCHSTTLAIEPASLKVCACEEQTFTLQIENKGSYLENYKIDVEGPAAKWISLSSKSISLGANSSATVEAYARLSCETAGNYEINFVLEAPPFIKANKKASIEIVPCYDYTISSEKALYSMCEAEETSIPIKIKNLGTADNTYEIVFDGPEWTKADQTELAIEEGKESTLNVIAKPPYGTEGSFPASIEVLSELGKVMRKREIELEVEKCYDVALEIEKEQDKICAALSNTYSVIIKNPGKFSNSYELAVEGAEWATLSDERIALNESEEASIDLKVSPPFETESATYNITVKAEDLESGVEASDIITVETITVEDCYKPSVSSQNDSLAVARDSAATLPFIVENKGTNAANYSIEISGSAATFCQINPGALTVKPDEAQTIYLYCAPPVETALGDYTITVSARLVDTTIAASKAVTISVIELEKIEVPEPEEELEEVNITNITNITNISAENITITAEAVEEGPSLWSRFIAWLTGLFKLRPKVNVTNITDLNVTNISEDEAEVEAEEDNRAPTLKEDIPDITFKEGETFTIDLADYFEDPDNDSLTYISVKPLRIAVTSDRSKITLSSEQGFIGITKTTFYAYDGNKITSSNEVQITVTAAEQEAPEATNQTEGNETAGNETNQTA